MVITLVTAWWSLKPFGIVLLFDVYGTQTVLILSIIILSEALYASKELPIRILYFNITIVMQHLNFKY